MWSNIGDEKIFDPSHISILHTGFGFGFGNASGTMEPNGLEMN